jgi:hypothetical protein
MSWFHGNIAAVLRIRELGSGAFYPLVTGWIFSGSRILDLFDYGKDYDFVLKKA